MSSPRKPIPTVLPHEGRCADPTGSVTGWIDGLRTGDPEAARQLWERYFRRMIQVTRGRLWGAERLAADEEDVALSAFDSFCRGAGRGRFPQLRGRDALWPLLVWIIAQKTADRLAHEQCRKRGGTMRRASDQDLDRLESAAPAPDFAAQCAEEFRRLLDRLPDPSLRAVAVLKFEGYSGDEVARHLGCGLRTVERKLLLIRRLWSETSP